MFTVRAESHGDGYNVYSCETYCVENGPDSDSGRERCVELTGSNDHLDLAFITLSVGDNAPYRVVFITNESGNTVDTIRAPGHPREFIAA